MLTSERIREPAKCIGGLIRSCRTQWFEERADEVAKLERVARAAKDLQECLTYDEDAEVWTFEERDDEDHKLWAALADLPEDALGG